MGEKGGVVGVVQADDMGDGMQCMDHPYRSNPGGICAFCLQEKLGKLVTSSKLTGPFFPLQPPLSVSSSSSSPAAASFRSVDAPAAACGGVGGVGGGIVAASGSSRIGSISGDPRTRIPILSASSHKKKKGGSGAGFGGNGVSSRKVTASAVAACTPPPLASAPAAGGNNAAVVLKRSKSVAARPVGGHSDGGARHGSDSLTADSPRKKSFWSFLYLSSSSSSSTATSSSTSNNTTSNCNNNRRRSTSSSSGVGDGYANKQQQPSASTDDKDAGLKMAAPRRSEHVSGESAESPMNGCQATASSSFGRKVERSRSVGCGSRSFSGDFLERISTGFGDCTLRRVESHRESKPKISLRLDHGDDDDDEQQRRRMKERIKCGGLFGGFGMALASSFWLSAAVDDDFDNSSRISSATPTMAADVRGRHNAAAAPNGRARHWGWAFGSPMRAFRPAASSKSLYTIKSHANASAAATNAISAINASNKLGKLGH